MVLNFQDALQRAQREVTSHAELTSIAESNLSTVSIRRLFEEVQVFRLRLMGSPVEGIVMDSNMAMWLFGEWLYDASLSWPGLWKEHRTTFLTVLADCQMGKPPWPADDRSVSNVLGSLSEYRRLRINGGMNQSHYSQVPETLTGQFRISPAGANTIQVGGTIDLARGNASLEVSLDASSKSGGVSVERPHRQETIFLSEEAQFNKTRYEDGSTAQSTLKKGSDEFEIGLQYGNDYKRETKDEELAIALNVAGLTDLSGYVRACSAEDEQLADVVIGDWFIQVTRWDATKLYKDAGTKGSGRRLFKAEDLRTALTKSIKKKVAKSYPEPHRQVLVVDASYLGLTLDQAHRLSAGINRSSGFMRAYIAARHWTSVIRLW